MSFKKYLNLFYLPSQVTAAPNYSFKKLFMLVRLFLFFTCPGLTGATETARVYISNSGLHSQNQQFAKRIIEKELKSLPLNLNGKQKAHQLSQKIHEIGRELIQEGINLNAYSLPNTCPESYLSFYAFPLWEGRNIPLTLYLFAWPSENYALTHSCNDRKTPYHGSSIHRHPCTCAMSVLKGRLTQQNYTPIRGGMVQLKGNEEFLVGEGDYDDLHSTFIHRLICRDPQNDLCFTLHAYGVGSDEEFYQLNKQLNPELNYSD